MGCGKTTVGQKLCETAKYRGRSPKVTATFSDADDYHPQENKDKMARGQALVDADRLGWLLRLSDLIRQWMAATPKSSSETMPDDSRDGQESTVGLHVLACSSLKRSYRDVLRGRSKSLDTTQLDTKSTTTEATSSSPDRGKQQADKTEQGTGRILFVHLKASKETIGKRLEGRKGHFVTSPLKLLDSQFATLEAPNPDVETDCIVVDVERNIDTVVDQILGKLGIKMEIASDPPNPITKK